jgi:flagellar protein FlbD
MILLTRLDRQEVALNPDLIESIEARPDTTIRLVTGQSQVVREKVHEVIERIAAWRTELLGRAGLAGLVARPLSRAQLRPSLADVDELDDDRQEIPA